MLYFINFTQVENINAAHGASFTAAAALGTEDLLAEIESACTFHKQAAFTAAALADARLYLQSVEAGADALAEYTDHYGNYRLTITPELEENVPWIVESLLERRAAALV